RWEVRAFRVRPGGPASGLRAIEAEALVPDARVFVLRVRHKGTIEEATADTVLHEDDVVAVAGAREVLVKVIGGVAHEVEDPELLSFPVEGVDVYVTSKAVEGKTLAELAQRPGARGVFLRKITRGATATTIPILPKTTVHRGDILTLVGRTQDTAAATKMLGVADRPTDVADVAFIGGAITLGALVGALVWKVGGVPLTLSTAGGALIAGLVFGWLRSTRPFFGRIPSSTVWFMNSVGLNVFIAVVGISAGPGFVNGLRTQGMSLFMWGIVATTVPLILGMYVGKYVFRFHDAILLGACSGARTTTASLNAGRGNPNWIATTPREGFFLLGQFALTESTRVMKHPAGLGGMPQSQGIAGRLEEWLTTHADMPGAPFMASMVDFAVKTSGFE